MENDIKVSVIIPMYKCSDYLENLFDMLCNQTLKEIEIICVLDGPDDSIKKIIDKRIEKDNRIIYLQQEHSNAGVARNKGLDIARGEYLLFLDADDLFNNDMVEKLYDKAKKNIADVVICSYKKMDNYKKTTINNVGFDYDTFPDDKVIAPKDIELLISNAILVPWNKLFSKQHILDHNIRFSSTRISNDVFFVSAAMICANRLVVIKEDLLTQRKFHNDDSISSNRKDYLQDSAKVMDELYDWLMKNGYWASRRRDYITRFGYDFIYHSGYEYNEKYVEEISKRLATKKPWKYMCNAEIINTLSLDVKEIKNDRQRLLDEKIILNIKNNPDLDNRINIINNRIYTSNKVLEVTKEKFGRNLTKRSNPVSWFFWSIRFRGLFNTLRKIKNRLFKKKEIALKGVICSGFTTYNSHNITFFIPINTYRKEIEIKKMRLTARCNGGYLNIVSGKNKDIITSLGPVSNLVISDSAPTRKDEIASIYTEIVPDIGINISIFFKNQILKNKNGTIADNNQPVSVMAFGKIILR